MRFVGKKQWDWGWSITWKEEVGYSAYFLSLIHVITSLFFLSTFLTSCCISHHYDEILQEMNNVSFIGEIRTLDTVSFNICSVYLIFEVISPENKKGNLLIDFSI